MAQPNSENIPQPEREEPKVEVSANSQADAEISFVERETRRRKRLLRFYLAMLAIPVALGIVVLIFGRSDSRMVIDEIKTQAPAIVKSAVGDQIKPTIKEEVKNQINPTLEQLGTLQTRQEKVEETTGSLKASQEETSTRLQRDNEALRSDLGKLDQGISEKLNKERQDLINERQALEKRVKTLEQQVKAISTPRRTTNNMNRIQISPQEQIIIPQQEKTPQ
jgi:ABC-type lipoprotein release transport system permease subunit